MADLKLSIGEASVELLASIDAKLDAHTKLLERVLQDQREYQRRGPVYVPIGGAGTSTSSGSTLAIDLGGPAALRRWELRQIIIGGVLFSSSVAGSAELVQSPSLAGVNEPALANVEDQAAALPKIAFYSSGQVLVRHPNHLFVVILSPSVSTTYTVGGEALDVPDIALSGTYTE